MLLSYLASSTAAAALFAPWLWTVFKHWASIDACTHWMTESLPWQQYAALLAVPAFVFGMINPEDSTAWSTVLAVGTSIAIVLVAVSLLLGWRYPRRSIWLLSVALIGLPLAVLATPDLLWGGQRCFSPRFHFPCYVGVPLLMVHVLTRWLESPHHGSRVAGRAAVVFLLTLGMATCTTIWHAETWWNKRFGWHDRLQVIRSINERQRP